MSPCSQEDILWSEVKVYVGQSIVRDEAKKTFERRDARRKAGCCGKRSWSWLQIKIGSHVSRRGERERGTTRLLQAQPRQVAGYCVRGVLLSRVLNLEMARMASVIDMQPWFYNNIISTGQLHSWQGSDLLDLFMHQCSRGYNWLLTTSIFSRII